MSIGGASLGGTGLASSPFGTVDTTPGSGGGAGGGGGTGGLPSTPTVGPGHGLVVYVELADNDYVDVSEWVSAQPDHPARFRAGRPSRFDDVAASTFSVVLRNEDGRFTPGNPNSPYFPNVVKGRFVLIFATPNGVDFYRVHSGRVTGWALSPIADANDVTVTMTSADTMAPLARRTMQSTLVEEARRVANETRGGCDVFPFGDVTRIAIDPISSAASTTFENKGVLAGGLSSLGTARIMRASAGTGQVVGSAPDGLLADGQLEFSPDGTDRGPVLEYVTQGGMRQIEFFFKIPLGVLPTLYDYVIADFWAGSTNRFQLRLANISGVCQLVLWDGTTRHGLYDPTVADDVWRKVAVYDYGGSNVAVNLNDGALGAQILGIGGNLATVDRVYFAGQAQPFNPGLQNRCPQITISGLDAQTEQAGVWGYQILGAPPPVKASVRFGELCAYAGPLLNNGYGFLGEDDPYVVRTDMAGRTLLELMQELARTVRGTMYADSDDVLTLVCSDAMQPETPIASIDLVRDVDATQQPPTWADLVDVYPTRVTATCPAGSITSVNESAESGGEYGEKTVATCAASVAAAKAVADEVVGALSGLRLSPFVVNLLDAENRVALWPALMNGLRPGARVQTTSLPSVIFGATAQDVFVESYEIVWTIEAVEVTVETSTGYFTSTPSDPGGGSGGSGGGGGGGGGLPSGFTVAGATTAIKVGAGTTITLDRPTSTAAGDLLVVVMFADNDGSLVAMTAPDGTWTLRGSGSSAAGFAKVWTKTATSSEPTAYTFTGPSGSALQGTLLRVTGADTGSPMVVSPTFTSSGSPGVTHVAPAVSPTQAGLLVCAWETLVPSVPVTWTVPGTMTAHGTLSQPAEYVAAIVASEAIPAGGGGTSTGTFMFGASGPGVADGTFNAWIDSHDLQYASTFADATRDDQAQAYPLWAQFEYGGWQKGIELAVGGIYPQAAGGDVGGDTWAKAAAGNYDARWQASANNIRSLWGSRPYSQLILGFARELNGNFSAWQVVDGQEANFRAAWSRWQNIVKATMPGVKTVLTFNAGTSSLTNVLNLWPSANPPDYCGVDFYNNFPHITDASGWASKSTQVVGGNPTGVEAWRAQAAIWGVPLAVSEWSNPAINSGGGGGGDAPYFVTAMLDFFYSNAGVGAGNVAYAGFFNEGTSEGYADDYNMFRNGAANPAQPLSAAALKAGADSVTGTVGSSTTRTATSSVSAATVGLGNLTVSFVLRSA